MNKTELRKTILDIFEEVAKGKKTELEEGAFSAAYNGLLKFLLKMVQKGKLQRPYDIDSESGRMVFVTKGGKKIIINDAKIGVTVFKTWKGKKDKNFFDYSEHDELMKFAIAN